MTRAARGRRRTAPAIDILTKSTRWSAQRGAKAVIRQAIEEAAAAARTGGADLSVLLTNDSAMRTLNRTWRGKDTPTNVLSFPASEQNAGASGHLGDIAIAYETTAREAKAEGKPFRHHLAHLAVHGFLHLAGYDHIADSDAEAMENLEIAVLRRLKIPNPYVARAPKG